MSNMIRQLETFFSLSFLVSLSLYMCPLSFASDSPPSAIYKKPGPLDFVKKSPGDIRDYGKETFQTKNWPWITAVTGGTLVLLVFDQTLVDKAKNLGDHLGISHTNYQKTFAR